MVKGQCQTNVIMVHDISSYGHAHTYQISLTYLKRQKSYGPYKLCQLFDLCVKGQGQMDFMMVRDTPSYDHSSTLQISLTYLERQKSNGQDIVAHYFTCIWPWGQKSSANNCHDGTQHNVLWSYTHLPNIIDLSLKTNKKWQELSQNQVFHLHWLQCHS